MRDDARRERDFLRQELKLARSQVLALQQDARDQRNDLESLSQTLIAERHLLGEALADVKAMQAEAAAMKALPGACDEGPGQRERRHFYESPAGKLLPAKHVQCSTCEGEFFVPALSVEWLPRFCCHCGIPFTSTKVTDEPFPSEQA